MPSILSDLTQKISNINFSYNVILRKINNKICFSLLKYNFVNFSININNPSDIKNLFIYKCSFEKLYITQQLWDSINFILSILYYSFEEINDTHYQIFIKSDNFNGHRWNGSCEQFPLDFKSLLIMRYNSFNDKFSINSKQIVAKERETFYNL